VQGYTGATPYVRWTDFPAIGFAAAAWLIAIVVKPRSGASGQS